MGIVKLTVSAYLIRLRHFCNDRPVTGHLDAAAVKGFGIYTM